MDAGSLFRPVEPSPRITLLCLLQGPSFRPNFSTFCAFLTFLVCVRPVQTRKHRGLSNNPALQGTDVTKQYPSYTHPEHPIIISPTPFPICRCKDCPKGLEKDFFKPSDFHGNYCHDHFRERQNKQRRQVPTSVCASHAWVPVAKLCRRVEDFTICL